jgi:hypothetical protein
MVLDQLIPIVALVAPGDSVDLSMSQSKHTYTSHLIHTTSNTDKLIAGYTLSTPVHIIAHKSLMQQLLLPLLLLLLLLLLLSLLGNLIGMGRFEKALLLLLLLLFQLLWLKECGACCLQGHQGKEESVLTLSTGAMDREGGNGMRVMPQPTLYHSTRVFGLLYNATCFSPKVILHYACSYTYSTYVHFL